jgi:quercetin dioxygenase-like cupin family protein
MELSILGPIGYRPFHLEKTCQENAGHQHNYDHVTYLLKGKVRVTYKYEQDGKEVTGEREYEAPDRILVKADVHHTIKALTDDVVYDCVFSHRDFDGLVTQKYQNVRAYE